MKNVKKNWDLLRGADILMLQETWIEKKDLHKVIARLDRNYLWYGKLGADKRHKTGRASAGQLIAVKRGLQAECKVNKWEYSLTLKIKKKSRKEAYTKISVYNNIGSIT